MDTVDNQVSITIRHLQHQVQVLKSLQKQLNTIIDPALGEYLKVSNIKKQTLILIADNSSIATHVKLIAPAIIDGMNARVPELKITAVKCKVKKPVYDGNAHLQKHKAHLSPNAAHHIAQTAAGIKNDRLKAALEKLSKNGR